MNLEDLQRENERLVGVLSNIRDIVEVPDPRFKTMEWYMAIVEHVRRFLREVFDDENDF